MADRGILSSLRYLFADFIGDDDDTPPFLPEGLPEPVMAVASDAIHLLIDYQGPSYADLYVDRLRRFVGKQGVDDAMLTDIARLMAVRMSYEDPIRIAQLKLAELDRPPGSVGRIRRRQEIQARGIDRRASRCHRRICARCARLGRLDEQTGLHPLQHGQPVRHPPPQDRGGTAAMAAAFGALCQGAGLGRTLAAHDRPQPDQAARRPRPRSCRPRP